MRKSCLHGAVLLAMVLWAGGCAHPPIIERQPDEPKSLDQEVEATVGQWIREIVECGPIATSLKPPFVAFCGIRNMSGEPGELRKFEHVFMYWGQRSNRFRLTAATGLPAGFFDPQKAGRSTVADKDAIMQAGKTQGWRYAIYGEVISERSGGLFGRRMTNTDLYLYMIDVQTGKEVWSSRRKFK